MHPLPLDMFLEMDRLVCSPLPSLGLFFFHSHTPSHAHIQTGWHTPSLPFCAPSPGPQLRIIPRYRSRHWVCPPVPPPLCHTHTFIFLLPSCALFHMVTLLFFFSFSLAGSLICSQSPKHIYTHSPSSARRCSHSQETRQPCRCWGLRSFPSQHHCRPSLGPAASSGIQGRGGR